MPDEDIEQLKDYDPEDSWDDGDPTDTKLDILENVIESIRAEKRDGATERTEFRRKDALRLCGKLEGAAAEERRDDRRLSQIREALEKL